MKVSCNTSKKGKLSSALKNFKQRLTQAPRRGYNTHMKNKEDKLVEALTKLLNRPGISDGLRRLIKRVLAA